MSTAVIQFFSLVVMWSHFEQPRVLDLDHLSHELLGGEDQFVVDEPARTIVGQTTVGVNCHSLLVFHRLVLTRLAQPRRVVEEPGSDRLPHHTPHSVFSSPDQRLKTQVHLSSFSQGLGLETLATRC